MRWERLFDDLEAQFAQEERAELLAEIADRTRRERAGVHLVDRLAAATGPVSFLLPGERGIKGVVTDVGKDFCLVTGETRHLIRLAAALQVRGLGRGSVGPREGTAIRRFGLGYALRALARDRCTVLLSDVTGRDVVGRLGAVGADYVEVAPERESGSSRRPHEVCIVPFSALAVVTAV